MVTSSCNKTSFLSRPAEETRPSARLEEPGQGWHPPILVSVFLTHSLSMHMGTRVVFKERRTLANCACPDDGIHFRILLVLWRFRRKEIPGRANLWWWWVSNGTFLRVPYAIIYRNGSAAFYLFQTFLICPYTGDQTTGAVYNIM